MASDLDERNLWYQVDEVAAASRMASLGFRPHCHESHLALKENISELYSAEFLCVMSTRKYTSVSFKFKSFIAVLSHYTWFLRSQALTIWMEFSVIPGRIQMERFIPVEIFAGGKKVIPFKVFPFSRFYRNSLKFLYHLSTYSARLVTVILPRKNAKDLKDGCRFLKRLSLQC